MFVKLNKYCVIRSEAKTFVEMIKLEQKMNAAPAGLDRYSLFKDKENSKLYWLTEFWISEADYLNYQKLESHKYFLDLLKGVLETKHEQHICEIVLSD